MSDKKCAFCNRENFEERIIYEDEWFFVIPTLGQFVPGGGYSLVIPRRHVRCVAEMEIDEIRAFARIVSRVAQVTDAMWEEYVSIFEHGIAGQTVPHAHVHVMPRTLSELDNRLWRDFPEAHSESIYAFMELLGKYAQNGNKPYLLCSSWYPYQPATVIFLSDPSSVSAQYLRSAAAEIITGDAANGDWRNADPIVDKERIAETIRRLRPYLAKDEWQSR